MKFTLKNAALSAVAFLFATECALAELERVAIFRSRRPNGQVCCTFPTVPVPCGVHTETWERWEPTAFQGGGIQWDLVQYSDGTLAPGLPFCTTRGAYPATVAAPGKWNTPPPPGGGGGAPYVQIFPIPYGWPALSSELKFSGTPANVVTYQSSLNLLASSAPNYVSFVNDQANSDQNGIFSTMGTNHVILGVTAVHLYNPNVTVPLVQPRGSITGFDIALNATTYLGTPVWGWVAQESDANHASYSPNTFIPMDGYADILGVLVHEFGHAAGLGHSVLDSENTGNQQRVPTMFPFAQVLDFDVRINVQSGCSSTPTQYASQGSSTVYGGILGKAARTLAPDDIVAVNRGYPKSNFGNKYATIRGRVTLAGGGLPSVSVFAIREDVPDAVRIGVLTYHFYEDEQTGPGPLVGEYELSGLPSGSYYVVAEPIDPTYINQGVVPNYGFNAGTTPWPGCNCGAGPPIQCYPPSCTASCCSPGQTPCRMPTITGLLSSAYANSQFPRELYDNNEGTGEKRQRATVVAVLAGNVYNGIDILVEAPGTNLPRLDVGIGAAPTAFTPRGLFVPAWANAAQTIASSVTLRVQSPSASYGNLPVEILLSYQLEAVIDNGQLREVSATTGPANLSGTLSAAGASSSVYMLNPASQKFRMLFAQARIETAPGVYDYTNPVTVFIGSLNPIPVL